MVSVTFPLDDKAAVRIGGYSWINWSDIAREELMKKEIFDRYLETGEVTDEDWKFCEEIDWHPVDEFPLKEEFVKKIEAAKKEKSVRLKSISEIFD